ncbi:TetR family transcriptional regulator [Geothrix limicola]|uniref:TetR family transcriptional regulator n=1 Tax=Geothrix limicola TaxID=2927978 RepID=A0ABQ5QFP9_9BACT|nr:TetR/AcrR family transcriptional regulator [Geothrix limicola]GLH72995.1 TetR family transcriptional regulator [Geothrix limicola]
MREAKKTKVLEAAEAAFLRYGYRRVTMGDIASAAGISRPALYIHFCNKETIFQGVLRAFMARTLEELRAGLAAQPTAEAKLRFAFEVWAVRPFGLLSATPDAKELVDCGFAFARGAIDEGAQAFEAELAAILAPLGEGAALPDPAQMARILSRAVQGFKQTAASTEELGALIEGLLGMVLPSLGPGHTEADAEALP